MAGKSRRSAARNRRRRVRRLRHRLAAEKREWTELPRDILTLILRKVGGIDVLWHAQAVCRPWRQLALDPEFWRIIDMRGHFDLFNKIDLEEPTRIAVDRSGGCVEELYLDSFGSDKLLEYIADRSTRLRRLVLISTYHIFGLAQFVTHCPLLEELQLTHSCLFNGAYKAISQACPQLKCFRLNDIWRKPNSMDPDDDEDSLDDDEDPDNEAIEIADSMPQLSELQLIGNLMTNKGLHAILNKCLQLESLDIRVCLSVNLDDNLRSKLAKIKDVKLPNDSIAGYEFQTRKNENIFGVEYLSGDSDPGLTYGDFFDYGTDFSYDDFSYDDFTVPDYDGDEDDDYLSFKM